MKNLKTTLVISLLLTGFSQNTTQAQAVQEDKAETVPVHLNTKPKDYTKVEKDLNKTTEESSSVGEEAIIETSHPYLLPRLFTLPTAYSLKSYEVRFGGQGNIHSTLANFSTQAMKASVAIGFGGIMELGYQLDEYYTVQEPADKILMGYFKLALLQESRNLPATAISASKNLRSTFRSMDNTYKYTMNEDMYEVVFSKAFKVGDNMISVHPGAQIIRDVVTAIDGQVKLTNSLEATKVNPRLGLSWQSHPKTLFMYEFKLLHPTDIAQLSAGKISTNNAMENNLGIRYYIRNWLCIDSGIRHFYNLDTKKDEMKLHANFVGVIPLETVYGRVQNYLKK